MLEILTPEFHLIQFRRRRGSSEQQPREHSGGKRSGRGLYIIKFSIKFQFGEITYTKGTNIFIVCAVTRV